MTLFRAPCYFAIFIFLGGFAFWGCIDDPDTMEASGSDGGVDAGDTGVDGGGGDVADADADPVFECLDGLKLCGDPADGEEACKDIDADPNHCGSCHHVCDTDVDRGVPVCMGGVCDVECESSEHEICGNRCVDTTNDPDHCGACGEVCRYGDCENGECVPPECDSDATPFGGGSGTADDPYVVCTAEQFNEISTVAGELGVHVVLASDIDSRGGEVVLEAIPALRGRFDGLGHTIADLSLVAPEDNRVALFGALYSGATVANVVVEAPVIHGNIHVAALVGVNHGSVENVEVAAASITGGINVGTIVGYSEGRVDDVQVHSGTAITGVYRHVGGLVGANYGSVASSSVDELVVHAHSAQQHSIGGLIGYHQGHLLDSSADVDVDARGQHTGGAVGLAIGSSLVEGCQAQGGVVGGHHGIGGLVGTAIDDTRVVESSSSAEIRGNHADANHAHYIGGLVGHLANDATVEDSSATGPVSAEGQGQQVGGLVGRVANNAEIVDSVASGDVDGGNYQKVGGLVGLALDSAQIRGVSSEGDVVAVHDFVGGLAGAARSDACIEDCNAAGDVTVEVEAEATGGLIGRVANSAVVDGCHASGDVTSGAERVGGLVGDLIPGTTPEGECGIVDSYATGLVSQIDSSDANRYGGLVGHVGGECEISASHATGAVEAGNAFDVGGLVGYVDDDARVVESFATGDATGYATVGGLAGCACSFADPPRSPQVQDSFATGDATVLGDYHAGGLVGWLDGSAQVWRAYSTGAAHTPGDGGYSVGLAGASESATVVASYWDIETSGLDESDRGEGLATTGFSDEQNFGDGDEQWDFDTTWTMPEESQLDDLEGADVVRPRLWWEFD